MLFRVSCCLSSTRFVDVVSMSELGGLFVRAHRKTMVSEVCQLMRVLSGDATVMSDSTSIHESCAESGHGSLVRSLFEDTPRRVNCFQNLPDSQLVVSCWLRPKP